jgi:hypothetical protein
MLTAILFSPPGHYDVPVPLPVLLKSKCYNCEWSSTFPTPPRKPDTYTVQSTVPQVIDTYLYLEHEAWKFIRLVSNGTPFAVPRFTGFSHLKFNFIEPKDAILRE